MFVSAIFWNEEYSHTFFACLFVLDSSLACFFLYTCAKVCGRSFFRTSNIHTLHSLFICGGRLSVWGFCYVCGRIFLERGVFTHLCLFICVTLIIYSVHGCFAAVTVRHEPSTFSGVGVHYLKFTSAMPFRGMTSGMTVQTVSNDS